jgi:hypothetical protein
MRADDREQMSEDRRQRTDFRRQRTVDAEYGIRWAEVGKKAAI